MVKLFVRLIKVGIPSGLILFALIQFIPYGHSHTNPPATHPATWSNPQVDRADRASRERENAALL